MCHHHPSPGIIIAGMLSFFKMVNPFNRVPYAGECRLNIRTAKGLKVNQGFQRERGKQEAGPVYGDGKYNPLESQERG